MCMNICGAERTLSQRDMLHFPDSNKTITVGISPCLAAKCSGATPSCIHMQEEHKQQSKCKYVSVSIKVVM